MEGYTVKEAARIFGLDPSHVRRLIRGKKIDGEKWGRDWVVLSLNYKKKKYGVGRKPKGDKK
ncbi:MAG: helix-turn-helix domain-containing protein [Dehalococcoidales bacterium]|nr:helix-turn-helix domain-containing protein [Dehalococcoidales bacterium]